MSERPRTWPRSALALLSGFLTVVGLSVATDAVLHAIGTFPRAGMSGGLFLLATVYRSLYAIAGSYITARVAPHGPMQHALIGGAVGLVISTVGAVATWNQGPAFGPHWYPIALIATALPTAWVGGKIRVMQLRNKPER